MTTVEVGDHQFIRVWQTSSSLVEVASKVRLTKNACRVRAFRYRKLGIPLKVFEPVVHEPINWRELADFARQLIAPKARTADSEDGHGTTEAPDGPPSGAAGDVDAPEGTAVEPLRKALHQV